MRDDEDLSSVLTLPKVVDQTWENREVVKIIVWLVDDEGNHSPSGGVWDAWKDAATEDWLQCTPYALSGTGNRWELPKRVNHMAVGSGDSVSSHQEASAYYVGERWRLGYGSVDHPGYEADNAGAGRFI